VLLAIDLGLGSASVFLFAAAIDVTEGAIMVSMMASDPVEPIDLGTVDVSVTEGAGVIGLLVSFAGVVVLVSTVLLAWAYFRCGGV
jgi:hypothetical protein